MTSSTSLHPTPGEALPDIPLAARDNIQQNMRALGGFSSDPRLANVAQTMGEVYVRRRAAIARGEITPDGQADPEQQAADRVDSAIRTGKGEGDPLNGIIPSIGESGLYGDDFTAGPADASVARHGFSDMVQVAAREGRMPELVALLREHAAQADPVQAKWRRLKGVVESIQGGARNGAKGLLNWLNVTDAMPQPPVETEAAQPEELAPVEPANDHSKHSDEVDSSESVAEPVVGAEEASGPGKKETRADEIKRLLAEGIPEFLFRLDTDAPELFEDSTATPSVVEKPRYRIDYDSAPLPSEGNNRIRVGAMLRNAQKALHGAGGKAMLGISEGAQKAHEYFTDDEKGSRRRKILAAVVGVVAVAGLAVVAHRTSQQVSELFDMSNAPDTGPSGGGSAGLAPAPSSRHGVEASVAPSGGNNHNVDLNNVPGNENGGPNNTGADKAPHPSGSGSGTYIDQHSGVHDVNPTPTSELEDHSRTIGHWNQKTGEGSVEYIAKQELGLDGIKTSDLTSGQRQQLFNETQRILELNHWSLQDAADLADDTVVKV